MSTRLMVTPCTITRRVPTGERDEYDGNYTHTTTTTDTVCAFFPTEQTVTEPEFEGELSDRLWEAFFPAGTVIGAGDMVTAKGLDFEVQGEPWIADDSSRLSHVTAFVRRAAGADDDS